MNNINNLISEELGKMSQLFNYQRGKVISEQDNATKKQYLKEGTFDEFVAKLPKETKAKFDNMNVAWQGGGTNEKGILDALNSFTVAEYNLYNQYLALEKREGVTSFSGMINHEMGYDNLEDVKKIANALKRFNLTGTYKTETRTLGSGGTSTSFKTNSFKITKGGAPAPAPNNGLTSELTACIKQYNGTAPKKSANPEIFYIELVEGNDLFFGIDYEAQYQRKGKPTIFGEWSCKNNVLNIVMEDGDSWSKAQGGWSGPQSKKTPDKDAVVNTKVKTGNTQKLSALTQDVQKSIGGKPTGKISSQELDSILQRLGGNDVSGEVSQSLPTDGSGKPDLDKILASLSQ